eukprot:4470122-Prymnesium_polylepis.1
MSASMCKTSGLCRSTSVRVRPRPNAGGVGEGGERFARAESAAGARGVGGAGGLLVGAGGGAGA